MKNRLAMRFAFAVKREIDNGISELLKDKGGIKYTTNEAFYIKLGAESAFADIATLVGANNSSPKTGPKWYVHSPRVKAVKSKG